MQWKTQSPFSMALILFKCRLEKLCNVIKCRYEVNSSFSFWLEHYMEVCPVSTLTFFATRKVASFVFMAFKSCILGEHRITGQNFYSLWKVLSSKIWRFCSWMAFIKNSPYSHVQSISQGRAVWWKIQTQAT